MRELYLDHTHMIRTCEVHTTISHTHTSHTCGLTEFLGPNKKKVYYSEKPNDLVMCFRIQFHERKKIETCQRADN